MKAGQRQPYRERSADRSFCSQSVGFVAPLNSASRATPDGSKLNVPEIGALDEIDRAHGTFAEHDSRRKPARITWGSA
jgi:hypothetical protein